MTAPLYDFTRENIVLRERIVLVIEKWEHPLNSSLFHGIPHCR